MKVSGSIKVINEEKQISASFKKRECVITTEETYPQHIMVEFTQDKCSDLDGYKVGDKVDISINIRGREWTNPNNDVKYFNSIQGWRIEKLDVNNTAPSIPAEMPSVPATNAGAGSDPEDDLPF